MLKWKDWAAIAVILLLFPYIAVVFSGKTMVLSEENVEYNGNYYISVDNGRTAEEMDLETYVTGAASSVLWPECEEELIKAQVILVRTNVVREIQEQTEAFDGRYLVRAETLTETYTGPEELRRRLNDSFEAFYRKLTQAVQETRGMILTYEDCPVEAAYHLVSNGNTRSGVELLGESCAYLQPVDSAADLASGDYFLRRELSSEQWEQLLTSAGYGKAEPVEILERDGQGYVKKVRIGEQVLSGETFRKKFGLHSADFMIENGKNGKIITTKGVGHGLGMSQFGANALAAEGKTFEELIACYFQGTELKKIE